MCEKYICVPLLLCCGFVIQLKCTNEVLYKRYPLGCSPHNVSPQTWEMDLQKSFLRHDTECAIWACQMEVRFHGLALSVLQQKLEECCFFFFFFLLRGRLNCWYTVHTNTDKALHAIGFQGHCCCYGGLSILYCLLAFPWLSEHTRSIYDEKQGTLYSNHAIAHRSNGCSNNYNLRIMNLAYTRWFLFW